jgi:hypothetical protein
MSAARIRIDELVIDIGQQARAEDAEETLRVALAILAGRLAGEPMDIGRAAPAHALHVIELEPLPVDWPAGPGAADRIADDLYRQLLGGLR